MIDKFPKEIKDSDNNSDSQFTAVQISTVIGFLTSIGMASQGTVLFREDLLVQGRDGHSHKIR